MKVDSTLTMLNLIMTVGSFFIAMVGMFLLIFGYINLKRAHKIVDDRIKGKLDSLKYDFANEFNKLQESTHKMISGYENHSKGNVDTAIELYKSAIEIFPMTFNGYPALGYAYLEKNNKADALLSFNKAVELFPDKITSYNDLARVHALLNNREGCVQNIKKMAIMDVGSIEFLLNDTVITSVVSEADVRAIYDATLGNFGA